jgi:hypothetical protein
MFGTRPMHQIAAAAVAIAPDTTGGGPAAPAS